MSFKNPDFTKTRCLGIAVCGDIITEDDTILHFLEKHQNQGYRSRYQTHDGSDAACRLYFGGLGDNHVHIDATKSEILPESDRSVEISMAEMTELLTKLYGASIEGRTYGRFIIPISDLPRDGLISTTMYQREEENISLRISDARCQIVGAPIRSVSWSLLDIDSITVDVEAATSSDLLEDQYLSDQLATIDAGFRVFVMGEKRHG